LVIAGAGFTVANASSGADIDPTKAAAAARPIAHDPGQEPIDIPVVKSPDAPLAGGGGYKISAAEEAKFKAEAAKEEEQRARMAEALANKPPEPPKPARKSSGARRPQGSSNNSPIKKGGAKFDPLNGSLD
jgi:hypothetical protein